MFGWLVLLFTLLPLAELYLLIRVGEWVGAAPTIGIVLVTGVAGAALARTQGVRVVREIQGAVDQARMPHHELLEGALVLAGGLMLVTPGILTDLAGLSLMIPPVRRLAARGLSAWVRRRVDLRVTRMGGRWPGEGGPDGGGGEEGPARDRTVDAPFERRDDDGP